MIKDLDDCIEDNKDNIGTNFWYLNKNAAAINQNDYLIAFHRWRVHRLQHRCIHCEGHNRRDADLLRLYCQQFGYA